MRLEAERVVRLVKEWVDVLGMGHPWTFTVDIVDDPREAATAQEDSEAYVEVRPHLFKADFTFHSWQVEDDAALDLTVCHEVVHMATWLQRHALQKAMPKSIAKAFDEQMVQRFSTALVALKRAGIPAATPKGEPVGKAR